MGRRVGSRDTLTHRSETPSSAIVPSRAPAFPRRSVFSMVRTDPGGRRLSKPMPQWLAGRRSEICGGHRDGHRSVSGLPSDRRRHPHHRAARRLDGARLARKWGDAVPHIAASKAATSGSIGDQRLGGPAAVTMAGFDGSLPDVRKGYDDIPRAASTRRRASSTWTTRGSTRRSSIRTSAASARAASCKLKEPRADARVRARLQRLPGRLVAAPIANRLIPVAAMPFWDVAAECAKSSAARRGHRAILAARSPRSGCAAPARDRTLGSVLGGGPGDRAPVSFHIGGGDLSRRRRSGGNRHCERTSRAFRRVCS